MPDGHQTFYRLVAAVRKSAMMQLILKTMGVGMKSEISRAVKRWKTQTQARRMRRWVQRMFLATYAYWVQEERQRRARPVWICSSGEMQGDEEGTLREAPYKWVRHNDEENYLGRFGRAVKMMRAAAYWRRRELGRRLIQFIVNVGWEPESSDEEERMSDERGSMEDLGPLLFEDRSPRADDGEDDEKWEMNGGAETMGLEASHDDERAVEYMQQEGLRIDGRIDQDGKQGNCCFRSLAAEAGWGSEKHQEMREALYKWVRHNDE